MINNRMLAVAAVLAMAVPALGAAAPIVVPPVPEQLVEGHTVFTVIEIARETNVTEERFAAAVAVLVREFQREAAAARFPGVLWFNDQYLVNPESNYDAVQNFRYPCGGAVLAVNAGDPDPRTVMARVDDNDPDRLFAIGADSDHDRGFDTGVPRMAGANGFNITNRDDALFGGGDYETEPTGHHYGEGDPFYQNYSWVGANVDTATSSAEVYTDAGTGLLNYSESYLITDPNDHSWTIDKYTGYTRVGTGGLTTSYAFPVWVVNMLGSPVFVPDDGASTCNPFYDLLTIPTPAGNVTVMKDAYEASRATSCATGVPHAVDFPVEDDPCMGYSEPSHNSDFCYGGQSQAETGEPCTNRQANPLRLYNALLYFKFEDLTVPGGIRDHSADAAPDTNGCQTGTEWICPGGDDNAEGNSHPFHPAAPPHTEREPCPQGFYAVNPTNHGGSDTPDVFDCTYRHATANIDVYYNGAGRPFPPVVRDYTILDLEGSAAPFQDHHAAYGH